MKKLFISMLAIAALASCAKEETLVADQGELIGFNSFVENSTRAADNTYGSVNKLTKFNVYGTVTGTAGTVNIYEGVEVTGTIGNADWSHDAQYNQYWIPGANYSFAAIVDANVATKDTNLMPLTLTTVADGNMNFKDMLFATAAVNNATADQARVNFNFSHLLSKVYFTVTSNAEGDYYHTIANIKVTNFETGTYTINGGTWAGTTAKDIEFGNVVKVTKASGAKTNATQMLLVPNTAKFNVTFTVELYKNDTLLGIETKTIPVDTDLVKGNSYNFTIDCSVGNPIKFGVVENINGWDDDHNDDGVTDEKDDVAIQ